MAIPLFVLKTLPLRRREMYAIAFILFLGLICIVASIVRFVFLWDFIYGDHDESLPSQQNIIVYTSELEVVIAVWAGCLPALRALLRRPTRNGTSVSETGIPSSMFSNNGRAAGGRPRGSRALEGGGVFPTGSASPAEFEDSERQVEVQSPHQIGNPVLAKGFGYGGYGTESDVEAGAKRQSSNYRPGEGHSHGDDMEHKFSIDSERDGSEVELRNIVPLSPRGFKRPQ